ncbi:MAG: glycosyltransferase family 2 protein [Nocardioides sp.]|uniref:glycosyltransferase family 2 protein n=1 Tax=Nocardioides sp. TaxID=35761 RepID=UPI003F122429
MDEHQPADLVVTCVTYNSARVIEPFLAALPAALESVPRCRVVVIDNASSDGTPDIVRTLAPWATLVPAGRNAGYAGGINLALKAHPPNRAAYVLNPDTVPSPGSVAALLAAVDRDPAVGIALPRIVDEDRQLQYSLRREPTFARALGEAVLGGTRASRIPLLGETVGDPDEYRDGAVADWATGAALLVTRAAIDAVGEWDERFFLYSEETDYFLRVRDAGMRVRLVDGAEVLHHGGDQAVSPRLWALAAVNRTRLYSKRHPRWPSRLYWTAVLANEATRAALGRAPHRAAVRALIAVGPTQDCPEPTPSILEKAGVHVL